MKVLRQLSDRVRTTDNKPFMDYYLVWTYNNKVYSMRIKPQFGRDYDKLFANSQEVPSGEPLEKYI